MLPEATDSTHPHTQQIVNTYIECRHLFNQAFPELTVFLILDLKMNKTLFKFKQISFMIRVLFF